MSDEMGFKFSLRELQNIASKIADKIIKEYPGISKYDEEEIKEIAISRMNDYLNIKTTIKNIKISEGDIDE